MSRSSTSMDPYQATELPAGADVVVIGGGLAGLELAKELSRLGADDVLVLEAGPGADLAHVNAVNDPASAIRLWVEPGTDGYFWRPWVSESAPHFADIAGLRRRLGGRSLYWHGVTLPVEPWALVAPWWPDEVIRDLTLSSDGALGLYERVRADLDLWRGAGTTEDETAGIDIGPYPLRPPPRAVKAVYGGGNRWQAYSPLDAWADDQRGFGTRPGIVAGVTVLGVATEGSRVSHVAVRHGPSGTVRRIRCGVAVLAAGTVENSRLAIQAMSALPGGHPEYLVGLVDKLVQGFVMTLDPEAVPDDVLAMARADRLLFTPCPDAARANLFVGLSINRAGGLVLDAWSMGEQLPSDEGAVRCVRNGEWPWRSVVRAGLAGPDREVVEAQRHHLQELWTAFCSMIGRPPAPLEFGDFLAPTRTLTHVLPGLDESPPAARPTTWSGPLGTEYHEAGTLPLGAVLDDRHELVAVKGLFAVGPSTFPRTGAANPSLTNMALARRLAGVLSA